MIDFGDLKAGDKFIWEGLEYEKNIAVRIFDNKAIEIPQGTQYD